MSRHVDIAAPEQRAVERTRCAACAPRTQQRKILFPSVCAHARRQQSPAPSRARHRQPRARLAERPAQRAQSAHAGARASTAATQETLQHERGSSQSMRGAACAGRTDTHGKRSKHGDGDDCVTPQNAPSQNRPKPVPISSLIGSHTWKCASLVRAMNYHLTFALSVCASVCLSPKPICRGNAVACNCARVLLKRDLERAHCKQSVYTILSRRCFECLRHLWVLQSPGFQRVCIP